jgi:hypothetical protein
MSHPYRQKKVVGQRHNEEEQAKENNCTIADYQGKPKN